jgi:hypothetical protein
MRSRPTATLVQRIKREAKRAAREGASSHGDALEAGARAAGYASWHELQTAVASAASPFPVDPDLPEAFDHTPNEQRSVAEIARWWDRPFALTNPDGTLTVRCLDGGAWDRSTYYGVAPTFEAAQKLAGEKLEAWRRFRMRPVFGVDHDVPERPYTLIRMPQNPHQEHVVIARFGTMEEATAALKTETPKAVD